VFVPTDRRFTNNQKGAIAEAAIAAEAIKLGIDVLKPIAEHGRYDLAFDLGSEFLRVQCKWGGVTEGAISIRTIGCYHSPTRGYVKTTYSRREIDAIAVYSGETDRCYLLPISLFEHQTQINLRIADAKNNQRAALNWAADYELGAIAQLAERLRGTQEVAGSNPASSISAPGGETTVGAHEFRNRFGWFMERASRGERFLVTRRNKPFARLLPP
jgi:prevent-host-death family protein